MAGGYLGTVNLEARAEIPAALRGVSYRQFKITKLPDETWAQIPRLLLSSCERTKMRE